MIAEREGRAAPPAGEAEALCRRVRCPVRVLHGSDDRCQPAARGRRLAELTGGDLVLLEDAGHLPQSRDPVKVTRLITEFADQITGASMHTTTWTRGPCRPRRALYLSSPIGLGHARRDVAVAKELKRLRPGLEIDWLAQHPVTTVLDAEGEHVHPASQWLASESTHIDRYPWIRDRALFVGNDDDIVPDAFGGDLPPIRDWTARHFSYSGYIPGFTPPGPDRVAALRAELGYRDDELVCVVSVGGSGV